MKKATELSPEIKKTCEALARAQARREKRLANLRSVYSYSHNKTGITTDNMILLDYATELAHKQYLEKYMYSIIANLSKEKVEELSNYSVVRLGRYDKVKNDFMRITPKIIVKIKDVIDLHNKLKKDKANENKN